MSAGKRSLLRNRITLTTDFADTHYQGILEGIVHTENPEAQVVTLTREVRPGDVDGAAFLMSRVLSHHPGGVHLGLVTSPASGPAARTLVVDCGRHLLVGPDNGILMPAARVLDHLSAYEVSTPRYGRSTPFNPLLAVETYAALAAHLSRGLAPAEVGPKLPEWEPDPLPAHREGSEGLEGRVLFVDGFGTLLTNVPAREIARLAGYDDLLEVQLGDRVWRMRLAKGRPPGRGADVVATVNAGGYLEIAAPQGRASDLLGVSSAVDLRVRPVSSPKPELGVPP